MERDTGGWSVTGWMERGRGGWSVIGVGGG